MKFLFKVGDNFIFDCKLKSTQCTATSRNGARCRCKVVIGGPYCWNHLLAYRHIRILPSPIPNAGKGIFAIDRAKGTHEPIFRKNDKLLTYTGEILNNEELIARYGDHTAPYAFQYKKMLTLMRPVAGVLHLSQTWHRQLKSAIANL